MSQARPKQRVLVRWNDDLDKSLLLFITHTCTEMGIKIPYDEVARRMGSTFTEGAIQQHIAKLRSKMAELNVAPVPGPPRRGAVTNRPSGVYTQKSRAGPPPPPPGNAARRQSNTVGRTLPGEEQEQAPGARKAGAKRKGKNTQIKRSDSDLGESDEEFECAEDTEYADQGSNKRKRGGRGAGGRAPARKVRKSNPIPDYDPKIAEIMESLRQADCRYDAQAAAMGDDVEHDDAEHSGKRADGLAAHTRGAQFDYSQYAPAGHGQGEDEEEEEFDADHPDDGFQSQLETGVQYAQDDQVSPTSQMMSGSCLERASGLLAQAQAVPYHQFEGHANQHFTYNFPQPMPQHVIYSSNDQANMDFGGWPPAFASGNYSHAAMPPPQSPWPGTTANMHGHQNSMASTRNPSTISNYSTQGHGDNMMAPQTPTLTRLGAQDISATAQPTPQGAGDSSQNSYSSPEKQGFTSALFTNQGDGAGDAPSFGYDFGGDKLFGNQFDSQFEFDEASLA